MRIMIIGASNDPSKFGNKAVRAYVRQGHAVLPVNPKESEIEGITCYSNVTDVPGPIDRALMYLPAKVSIKVLEELATRDDVNELWLNPGADDPDVVDKARALGFDPIRACSIMAIGERP